MPELDIIPIGSFTIFVNTNTLWDEYPTEDLRLAVADTIIREFRKRLNDIPDGDQIIITAVETRIGCLLIVISLGQLFAGVTTIGAVTVGYNLIKDYDKLKQNIPIIIKDFKNIFLKFTIKKSDNKTVPTVELLPTLPSEFAGAESGQITFKGAADEDVRISKIGVMRDDILDCLILDNMAIKMDIKKEHNNHLKYK